MRRRFTWALLLRGVAIAAVAGGAWHLYQATRMPRATEKVRLDLWDDFDHVQQTTIGDLPPPDAPPPYARTRWMDHRVVASNTRVPDLATCFYPVLTVGPGEVASAIPIFNPKLWDGAPGETPTQAGFQISVIPSGEYGGLLAGHNAYYGELTPGTPGAPVRIRLDQYVGQRVAIMFCASLTTITADPPEQLIGWAEPEILEESDR
jgi:hypothetical protein